MPQHAVTPQDGSCSIRKRSAGRFRGSRTRSSSATSSSTTVALVGIHTRGVPLAQRLRRLIAERAGDELELGQLDITFHRDDVHVRDGPAPRRAPADRARHEARLRARGPDRDPRRRRPLHGPHDPRRDRRAARVRAPGARPARRAGRPRPPRAADPPRLRGQEPPDRARAARPGAADRGRRDRPGRARRRVARRRSYERAHPAPARSGRAAAARARPRAGICSRSPISTRDDLERLLSTARSFALSQERETKKLPTLRGRLVVNVFYESSTRTSASFELAAKRLSADTLSIKASGSSVEKGESLKDTALTLSAYDPDVIVIRHPQIGAPQLARRRHRRARRQCRRRQAPASDAGAARPLRDRERARSARRASTSRSSATSSTRASRARSIQALRLVGASVILVGPPPLVPAELGEVAPRHRGDRGRRRRLRPADAARADGGGRQLRPLDARVHRPLVRHARAPAARPVGHASRAR